MNMLSDLKIILLNQVSILRRNIKRLTLRLLSRTMISRTQGHSTFTRTATCTTKGLATTVSGSPMRWHWLPLAVLE